jgi:hypothetical protein
MHVGAAVIGQNPDNTAAAGGEGYAVDPVSGVARATGLSDEHRVHASWTHWIALIGWISVVATGGTLFMVPSLLAMTMWLVKKDKSPFVDDHGREALNFQLSLLLLGVLLIPVSILTCGVGAVLYVALPVLTIVGTVLAGTAALRGEYFRYPVCIRMISPPARA